MDLLCLAEGETSLFEGTLVGLMIITTLFSIPSDGVLNPAGVRFGSAEIYNIGKRGFVCEGFVMCVMCANGEGVGVLTYVCESWYFCTVCVMVVNCVFHTACSCMTHVTV